MAMNQYLGTNAANGNPTNTLVVKADMLKSADAVQLLDKFAVQKSVPMKSGETVTYMRRVTPDASVTAIGQGVNPVARALTYEPVSVTFSEFAEAFMHSSRQDDLGEMDVLMDSKDRLKDLIARTREKNGFYTYRACNNVLYPSTALTTRNQINATITTDALKRVSRLFSTNRASQIRKMTKGSLNQGTVPVQSCYGILAHTDTRQDYEALAGWIPAPQVGGAKDECQEWIGNVGEFMVFLSPEFDPYLAGGAAIGATGLKSVGGVSVDVYTSLVFGSEAFGKVGLKKFNPDNINVLDGADKFDTTNATRIVSCRWYDAPLILNQNWIAAIEHGVSA